MVSGHAAGHAIADVLTGRFNPTARLPVVWPREAGQIPIFYAGRSASRPANADDPYTSKYLDLSTEPLFPFGHGLSYSRVRLENLRANRIEFAAQEKIQVEVEAINEGEYATEETVFLFIHDLVARVARPLLELKAWAKVELAAGQTKTVTLVLTAESFCYPGETFELVLEPGVFDIHVGLNADRNALLAIRLHAVAG